MIMFITPGDSGIVIEGHVGTWHALYSYRSPDGAMYHVLEHERYGSDAEWLYVTSSGVEAAEEVMDAIVDGVGGFEEVV